MLMFRLAEHLHQPLSVVQQMSFEELSGWIAYFKIKKKDE
jgi:hypothetical protein